MHTHLHTMFTMVKSVQWNYRHIFFFPLFWVIYIYYVTY